MKLIYIWVVLFCTTLTFTVDGQKRYLSSFKKNESYQANESFKTVTLVSLFRTEEESRNLEASLASLFDAMGMTVFQTHEKLHGSGPKSSKEEIINYLSVTGTDFLLVAKLIPYSKEKKAISLPPLALSSDPKDSRRPTHKAVDVGSHNFYTTIAPAYKVVDNLDYWNQSELFRIEFSLYSVPSKMMVWSGVSVFLNGKKIDKKYSEICDEVIQELKKENFIK